MSDYISREAFIADCEGRYCAPCKEQGEDANGVICRACWVDDMLSEVLDAPAADVEPVRRGKWNIRFSDEHTLCLECSECGRRVDNIDLHQLLLLREYKMACWMYPYCHCGAKMELEDENDDRPSK